MARARLQSMSWGGRLYLAGIGALLLLALAYHIKGIGLLVFGEHPADGLDLSLRWAEERCFLKGVNPFDVSILQGHHSQAESVKPIVGDGEALARYNDDRGIDPAHPPWGYVLGLAFLWPPREYSRPYYAGVTLLSSAFLFYWAFRTGVAVRSLKRDGWFLAAAVLAIGGGCTAMELGQYSIPVTALLAASLLALQRDQQVTSGLALGLSAIKPTISGPFFLLPLITFRLKAFCVSVLYLGAASVVTWIVTGASPLLMLRQLRQVGARIADRGSVGVVDYLVLVMDSRDDAMMLSLAVVLVPMCLGIWLLRQAPPLFGFAVAAVGGRLWTYHKSYDNVMLAFLLVALGVLALRDKRLAKWMFVLTGFSLWMPGSLKFHPLAQLVIWAAAAVTVVALGRKAADQATTAG